MKTFKEENGDVVVMTEMTEPMKQKLWDHAIVFSDNILGVGHDVMKLSDFLYSSEEVAKRELPPKRLKYVLRILWPASKYRQADGSYLIPNDEN